jgi:hypothetical protein
MPADPFRNYDAWLEAPYQRAAAQAEAETCPECDQQTVEADDEGAMCTNEECDWAVSAPDPYDEMMDRRMEDAYDRGY